QQSAELEVFKSQVGLRYVAFAHERAYRLQQPGGTAEAHHECIGPDSLYELAEALPEIRVRRAARDRHEGRIPAAGHLLENRRFGKFPSWRVEVEQRGIVELRLGLVREPRDKWRNADAPGRSRLLAQRSLAVETGRTVHRSRRACLVES